MSILDFLLVGLGGALGAMARYGVGVTAPVAGNSFPVATFIVNVLGGLLMGLLVGGLAKLLPETAGAWRLFLGVGVLGGFTTFSAFSVETVLMIERGELAVAGLYVVLSVVLSVAAVFAGLLAMRQLA